MSRLVVRTNLNAQSDVTAIKPLLDETRGIERWSAVSNSNGIALDIEGNVTADQLDALLQQRGFRVVEHPAHTQARSHSRGGRNLRLLPKEALIKTGPVDHADWVYKMHVGWLQKARMRIGVKLLPEHSQRLLEIGYGSGILMPELSAHTDELFGIDPHPCPDQVTAILKQQGVTAQLTSASAEQIPFPDQHFDTMIAISSLEFIPDIEAGCREMRRVLRPDGRLIVVTPGHSPILDFGLKLLTGKSAATDYDVRREKLLPTLQKHFRITRWVKFPPVISAILPVYHGLELRV